MTRTLANEPRGERAHAVHQRLLVEAFQATAHFLEAGKLLVQIKHEELYRDLGYETFDEYLDGAALPWQRAHSYTLMRVARTYSPLFQTSARTSGPAETGPGSDGHTCSVTYADLLDMGVHKADLVRKLIRDAPPEDAAEWVAKAKTLRVVDLEREVKRAARGGQDDPVFDYLVGVEQRLMAFAAELPRESDPQQVVRKIEQLCRDTLAWLHTEPAREPARGATI